MTKNFSLILFIFCILLFIPYLGHVHLFDWDEINFAECAREMILSKNYLLVQIDFKPFFEKPPFFIWLQMLSMKAFGINEFAARFPNALMGIISILSIYFIGKKTKSESFGRLWALAYMATWLPHFYFKSGIIDPSFNFFIFISLYFFYLFLIKEKLLKNGLLSALFLGLAVLTKGPVAVLLFSITIFVFLIFNKKFWSSIFQKQILAFILLFSIVSLTWFIFIYIKLGFSPIQKFIEYQIALSNSGVASHGQPFYYHFIVLLIGCFPFSVFLFNKNAWKKSISKSPYESFPLLMFILFWVVLLIFSIVKTKIVHYSSLCYFPLTYIAALYIDSKIKSKKNISKWSAILFLSLGFIWSVLLMALPIFGLNYKKFIPLIKDEFVVQSLSNQVSWNYAEVLIGLIYFIFIIYIFTLFIKIKPKKLLIFLWLCKLLLYKFVFIILYPK